MLLKCRKFWKIPLFSAFSLIPFLLLHEEVWTFWIPYLLAFSTSLFTKKKFKDNIVLLLAMVGLPIAILHYKYVAKIDLLFFARLLLFIQLGLHLIPMTNHTTIVILFINFVLVLVAAALTFEFWFAIYLLLFLFLLIYIVLDLQFSKFQHISLFKYQFVFCCKLVLFLILCSYFLFLLVPRYKFDKLPAQLNSSISGFSDTVSFNDFTNILTSNKVAMRVKTDYPPSYYRGISLDTYDGSSWYNSSRFWPLNRSSINSTGLLNLPTPHSKNPNEKIRIYDFQLLPSKNKYLFMPQYAQSIKIRPPILDINVHGDLRKRRTLTKNLEYRVFSATPPISNKILNSSPKIEANIAKNYLKLPKVKSSIRKLSQNITRNSSGYWQKVNDVLKSFESRGYKYSLKSYHPGNPLESFLLENKVGHCQYFAGAMVLLLRLNGIPSRLVNGFTTGDYNEWGDYYTIRHKHAHSWVEVYAGNGVWIIKDPTPLLNTNFNSLLFLSHYYEQWIKIKELLDFKWQEYILYYSLLDQQLLWISLKNWFMKNPWFHFILIVLFIIANLMVLKLFFNSFESKFKVQNKFIVKLDRLLLSMGHKRPSNVGILEFVETVKTSPNIHQLLIEAAETINKITYSDKDKISIDDQIKFNDIVKQLKSFSKT